MCQFYLLAIAWAVGGISSKEGYRRQKLGIDISDGVTDALQVRKQIWHQANSCFFVSRSTFLTGGGTVRCSAAHLFHPYDCYFTIDLNFADRFQLTGAVDRAARCRRDGSHRRFEAEAPVRVRAREPPQPLRAEKRRPWARPGDILVLILP